MQHKGTGPAVLGCLICQATSLRLCAIGLHLLYGARASGMSCCCLYECLPRTVCRAWRRGTHSLGRQFSHERALYGKGLRLAGPGMSAMNQPQGMEFPPRWFPAAIRCALKTGRAAATVAAGYLAWQAAVLLLSIYSQGRIQDLWGAFVQQASALPPGRICAAAAAVAAVAAAALLLLLLYRRKQPVYLLDFECYKGNKALYAGYDRLLNHARRMGCFSEEVLQFLERVLKTSGLSGETFGSPAIAKDMPNLDMDGAREEAEEVMFGTVEDLLRKTGLEPRQIDVLITNCSMFSPTPSLSAMLVNRFKMRSDVDAYHLGGMGCSAGVIAVDLAQKLLRERASGGYALVVSTENVTLPVYKGKVRSMLIPNAIFRTGASAMLLTNKRSERWRAKYQLDHVVRVHIGADDAAYRCVYQHPDEEGHVGVNLARDLGQVAVKALMINMTRLGAKVLPWSEKLTFAANWVAQKLLGTSRVAPYYPDFKQAFNHFCLHAGGRAIIEGLSKHMGLSHTQMAPSTNALYWFGNTSSSTTWYSLGYVESFQGVSRGDTVWQIAFGSGFKCNSAVWRALRPVKDVHACWERVEGREGEAMEHLLALRAAREKEKQEAALREKANGVHKVDA